jgi:hypothetical protein
MIRKIMCKLGLHSEGTLTGFVYFEISPYNFATAQHKQCICNSCNKTYWI